MPKRRRQAKAAGKRFKRLRRRIKGAQRGGWAVQGRIPRRKIIGFPKKMCVSLKYVTDIEVPSHEDGAAPYIFRMNSIFDPDVTSTGHQPFGHDQYQAIYSKYCVIGAKVKVEILSNAITSASGDAGSPTFFMYLDDNTTTDNRSITEHLEVGMKNKYLISNIMTGNGSAFARPSRVKTIKWSARKWLGLSKKTQMITARTTGEGDETGTGVAATGAGAAFGANPSASQSCYLKMKMFDGGDVGNGTRARVTIDYLTVVYDPKEVGQS